MPKLSYLTHFDKYIITVTALIFLQYVATTAVITLLPAVEMRRGMFYMFAFSFAVACVMHAWIIRTGRKAMRRQLDGLQSMGCVDECARRVFNKAGVTMCEDGTVSDLSLYHKVLIEVAR